MDLLGSGRRGTALNGRTDLNVHRQAGNPARKFIDLAWEKANAVSVSQESSRPPTLREQSLCPCKSKKRYDECCLPFHKGKKKPPTAEELMRSRFSAYFFGLADYLFETTHPDRRGPNLGSEIEETLRHATWRFLTVVAASKGGPEDKTGKVEFIAEYFWDGEPQELHEVSRFKRFKGAWKYLDSKG